MKKIPTIFVRDETQRGHPVTPVVKPECQWVLDGEGVATVKLDGTNVKIEHGVLFKRQKPKEGDYDEASYVQCRLDNPEDRWAYQAFAKINNTKVGQAPDGIYELIGPKVNGNAEYQPDHVLVRVLPVNEALVIASPEPVRTFVGLQEFLASHQYEGLVFHHPDGRMAKIKRRDFGLPWPVKVMIKAVTHD